MAAAVRSYRLAMRDFAGMRTIDVWYARQEVEPLFERWVKRADGGRRRLDKALTKARAKDSVRAFAKLTHDVDGRPRIVSAPPLIVPVEELAPGRAAEELEMGLRRLVAQYAETLPDDRRALLDGYEPVHFAHKVVGVGSVGAEAWIVLFMGRDASDPLFLQVKEATASVLEPFAGASAYAHPGRRVVEGQRLMQAASDILLGWLRVERGRDDRTRDYYVRQLWDARPRRSSTRCRRRNWRPTPRRAAGRWPAPTPAPATAPRSAAISATAIVWTAPWCGSPRRTPIRTSVTSRRSQAAARAAGSSPRRRRARGRNRVRVRFAGGSTLWRMQTQVMSQQALFLKDMTLLCAA